MGSSCQLCLHASKHFFVCIASVRRAPAQVDESYASELMFACLLTKPRDVCGHSTKECLGITHGSLHNLLDCYLTITFDYR